MVDIAASGFTIPGQLTVPMICAPTIFFPHPLPQSDYTTTTGGETSPTGGLEYPPRLSIEALEDYELVESSRPASTPPFSIDHFNSDGFDQPEPSLTQRLRTSPSPPEPNLTEPLPHPLVSLTQSLQTVTLRTPGPPGIGTPQTIPGTHLPGPSDQSPPNSLPHPENNNDAATTETESQMSSSVTNPVSMTDFLNAINVVSGVTIHRTVKTTSVRSATHTNLTISLNIAHNYEEANEFLSQGLFGVIQLLMALRRTTLIRPPSPTSPTSPTSTEEETPPIYTIIRITDDREPITLTTNDGEERTFVPVRYVNGATVFEAGTSNQNRG
ncbi:hypothetical protein Moror_6203 [Moniliophthora roreri MCA 2997]|uniref:Uncharacterized protein n=1 Tax=Moniliophthora roreri (strain MCA 2997) TaxID=1381753 RepID=V2XYH4_MONRO|nr:hypothetical protein Moror_6203 [Moniliophthora roreri MCA 2997]